MTAVLRPGGSGHRATAGIPFPMLGCLLLTLALSGCDGGALAPQLDGEVAQIAVPALARDDGRSTGVARVSPGVTTLEVGTSVQMLALDEAGRPVEARWSSSDPSVASVGASGLVQGQLAGEVEIRARTRKREATATVRVSAASLLPQAGCLSAPQGRRVDVASAGELASALADAQPGDRIVLRDGRYPGRFSAQRSGTPEAPIWLCGSRAAVLDGGDPSSGFALLLEGDHWVVEGFSLTNAQGGIRLRGADFNVLRDLEVYGTGQQAIHLGWQSSDNRIESSWIHHTGLVHPEYGEGVYIGSHHGHWCARTACAPDRSDRNQIVGNRFGPGVTAEHIDVKEGTTGGLIERNAFDGHGMVSTQPWIDSWVILHGNGYLVRENRGTASPEHGFRVEGVLEGWGNQNRFVRNHADVRAAGYGFRVGNGLSGNQVECDNTVEGAGAGFSNVRCS